MFYVQNIPINLLMQELKSIFNITVLVLVSKWTEDVEQVRTFIYLHVEHITFIAASYELANYDAANWVEVLWHRLQQGPA